MSEGWAKLFLESLREPTGKSLDDALRYIDAADRDYRREEGLPPIGLEAMKFNRECRRINGLATSLAPITWADNDQREFERSAKAIAQIEEDLIFKGEISMSDTAACDGCTNGKTETGATCKHCQGTGRIDVRGGR